MGKNFHYAGFIISIHAPHEGERPAICRFKVRLCHFNPRSPRGGATRPRKPSGAWKTISIHAPHEGERLFCTEDNTMTKKISIHAPHEGERHCKHSYRIDGAKISIHAPHEGERRADNERCYKGLQFQSTLPTRGSDCMRGERAVYRHRFQSTLPTRGSDCFPLGIVSGGYKHFNPRSPRGGATHRRAFSSIALRISIHAPHEGERLDSRPQSGGRT